MSEPTSGIITAWLPDQDQHRLAVLGKLAEECNELGGRAARSIIQGLDGVDPISGLTNRKELEREIADVMACINQAVDRLGIMLDYRRQDAKYGGFDRWHQMIDREASDVA